MGTRNTCLKYYTDFFQWWEAIAVDNCIVLSRINTLHFSYTYKYCIIHKLKVIYLKIKKIKFQLFSSSVFKYLSS